jgi:hypothetical protein
VRNSADYNYVNCPARYLLCLASLICRSLLLKKLWRHHRVHHPAHHLDSVIAGCRSRVATQPQLGIWTKRRNRVDRLNPGRPIADGPHLIGERSSPVKLNLNVTDAMGLRRFLHQQFSGGALLMRQKLYGIDHNIAVSPRGFYRHSCLL